MTPPPLPKKPPVAIVTPVSHYGYARLCYATASHTWGKYLNVVYTTPDKVVEFQMSPDEAIQHAKAILRLAKQLKGTAP